MRHQKKGHKLGRSRAHRKRTLQALSCALIEHKRIRTTTPKAKALRPFIEPLITRAKTDTTHNRRQVFRRLQSKHAVTELFSEVGPMAMDRPGGYTRIIKIGPRPGDSAEMAMIELVDYNDVQPDTSSSRSSGGTRRGSGKGRRRRSGGGSSKSSGAQKQSDAQGQSDAQEQQPEATTTQTADQQEAQAGVETETVEEPVDAAQKEPVPERTEPTAEAEEAIADADVADETEAAEADEAATAETADEAPADEADEASDEEDEDEEKS